MAANTFDCKDAGRKGRPADDMRPVKSGSNAKASIFARKWCTSWIDEAHEFRGLNRGFVGGVQLRSCSRMVACLTATPLYTSPKV
jgi:hypothetical protein